MPYHDGRVDPLSQYLRMIVVVARPSDRRKDIRPQASGVRHTRMLDELGVDAE